MIQHSKKKQTSDFKPSDNAIIHRNPPTPPMRCFDDTFVSMFEIALSLELQNAFKQSDISILFHSILFTFLHPTPSNTCNINVPPSLSKP